MLKGTPIKLPAMLDCREERAQLQSTLLTKYHKPLISFALNIPGPVKTTAELASLFAGGLAEIRTAMERLGIPILEQHEKHEATGDEAMLVADSEDAGIIKEAMTAIEESRPIARLFDIDVLDANGAKLSRPIPRRCLICGNIAQACARSRKHTVEELAARIEEMLEEL